MPPPPPGLIASGRKESSKVGNIGSKGWQKVEAEADSVLPCQRSLHAGAIWKDSFVVFGGYDGHHRVNDLYSFNFTTNQWRMLSNTNAPTPRDRHVATVFDDSLYIFGGFDGTMRVNDLHSYNLETNEWQAVEVLGGTAPSPRHSHAAVVYHQSMYVFGGYDGSYRSDLHEFNFYTRRWTQVCPLYTCSQLEVPPLTTLCLFRFCFSGTIQRGRASRQVPRHLRGERGLDDPTWGSRRQPAPAGLARVRLRDQHVEHAHHRGPHPLPEGQPRLGDLRKLDVPVRRIHWEVRFCGLSFLRSS